MKNGEVDIYEGSSGEEKLVVTHGPGEFTGDIDMLTGRVAIVSGIAKTDCCVYEISAVDLRRILNEIPQLGDILLRAFLMRRQMLEEWGLTGARVVGSRFSKDTHRIREFLSRHRAPFTWIDLENDPSVDELLKHFDVAKSETPIVVCGRGAMARNPSNAQLADHIGIRKPLEHVIHDLVIVGAGPAGLAAAVYGASEGLKTVLLDRIGATAMGSLEPGRNFFNPTTGRCSGHVGCCDSSKNKHATKHYGATDHPIVQSIEPGESWRWCYPDQLFME